MTAPETPQANDDRVLTDKERAGEEAGGYCPYRSTYSETRNEDDTWERHWDRQPHRFGMEQALGVGANRCTGCDRTAAMMRSTAA